MSTTDIQQTADEPQPRAEAGAAAPSETADTPRRRDGPNRSPANDLWYQSLKVLTRMALPVLFRFRGGGREHLHFDGAGLLIANHQSHLDPLLIGAAADRRLNYLARESLFRFPPLRWLIRSLGAIPIDRDGSGLGGLKETLNRLKQGELVLIFAEGTRTPDGAVHPLKPGFLPLARRGGVPLVPVGIDGAFEAWPRSRRFPTVATIRVEIGPPLLPEEFDLMSDEALLAEMHRRVAACHQRAGRLRRRGSLPVRTEPSRSAKDIAN
ncbi:MAG: lysophospholipid acyltransferase family protein [Pirellulales bacterium]